MVSKRILVLFISVLLGGVGIFYYSPDVAVSQTDGGAAPASYHQIGVQSGVYNEGQAAPWDLNILDFYRIFGHTYRAKGYQPEQPIKFSHAIHVGKNKMECQYCHWSVAKAAFAAIPEAQSCMGCHQMIRTNSPEIQKLTKFYQDQKPVPWVKVHVMPDHVRFNHKRHVKAGVACQECHGQIPEMDVVERVSSMKMGWCVSCHRERGTSIDCWTCHK